MELTPYLNYRDCIWAGGQQREASEWCSAREKCRGKELII